MPSVWGNHESRTVHVQQGALSAMSRCSDDYASSEETGVVAKKKSPKQLLPTDFDIDFKGKKAVMTTPRPGASAVPSEPLVIVEPSPVQPQEEITSTARSARANARTGAATPAERALQDPTFLGRQFRKTVSQNPDAITEVPNKYEIQVNKESKGWKTVKVHNNERAAAAHYRRTQVGPKISKRILVNGKVVHVEKG